MDPNKNRLKEIVLSLSIEVPEEMTQEEIANRITEALAPLADSVANVSDLAIRAIPKLSEVGPPDGGYTTRLWEKATCATPISPGDPREKLISPERQIEQLIQQAEHLTTQASLLNDAVIGLKKRING